MSDRNPFFGATFAERKALREGADKATGPNDTKQVDETKAEDKAVSSASTKRAARKK